MSHLGSKLKLHFPVFHFIIRCPTCIPILSVSHKHNAPLLTLVWLVKVQQQLSEVFITLLNDNLSLHHKKTGVVVETDDPAQTFPELIAPSIFCTVRSHEKKKGLLMAF